MTSDILRYYREEMRYLHEEGERFALAHPDEARLLKLGALADRDPYVERLFEGFAFLTARIRERLDDELPQYTEGLLDLLWPHLLRPVPALSVVEFRPTPGLVSRPTSIARGAEVRSAPVGEDGTVCRFTTTQAVRLQPLQLVDATMSWPRATESVLTLRFRVARGGEPGALALDALRLYLHADRALASQLHRFLTRHVATVRVRGADGEPLAELRGQRWVAPGGFGSPGDADDDALLPYSPYTFQGVRLLQEYFAFRQKFAFVDLHGLDRIEASRRPAAFEVALHFDTAFPQELPVRAEHLRLYCTPAVNLFAQDGAPLRVDHRSSAYRVVADLAQPRTVETYDVRRVTSEEDGTRRRHVYQPYHALGRAAAAARWFTTARRAGVDGADQTYLTFGGAAADELRPETCSVELRCTNGRLPHEALREGMLRDLGPDVPRVATVQMLVRPTAIQRPPATEQRALHWRLLSHLSLGHRALATRDGLVDLLTLYDWSDDAANRRRIAGVRAVRARPAESVVRRAVVRGTDVEVEVAEEHFGDEGDVALFGLVLSRLLGAYTTINSFARLAVVATPSRARLAWPAERGSREAL